MHGVLWKAGGSFVPPLRLSNNELIALMDKRLHALKRRGLKISKEQEKEFTSNDEWIQERTGIRQRYFCPLDNSMATSDLAVGAARRSWANAYDDDLEILPEFIIVGTVSPDYFTTPPTSIIVHRKLGVPKTVGGKTWPCVVADITLACTSFMQALQYGCMLIETGRCQRGMVIGADRMSSTISWSRRSPLVILGDGASCLTLEATTVEQTQFPPHAWVTFANGGKHGKYEDLIKNWAGGSAQPLRPKHVHPLSDAHLMNMNGNPVHKIIGPYVAGTVIPAILDRSSLSLRHIQLIVLHQANQRIIEYLVKKLQEANPDVEIRIINLENLGNITERVNAEGKPIVRVFCNIERYGNMTSASVPTAMCEAREAGLMPTGTVTLIVAMGGGLSACGTLMIA